MFYSSNLMASNEGKAFKYVVWLGKLENMSVFDSQGETSSIKVKKGLSWDVNVFLWGLKVPPVKLGLILWLSPHLKKQSDWKKTQSQHQCWWSPALSLHFFHCTVAPGQHRESLHPVIPKSNILKSHSYNILKSKTCSLTVLEWEQALCSSGLWNINI